MPKEFLLLAFHSSTTSYGGPREFFLSTFHALAMSYGRLREFFLLVFQTLESKFGMPIIFFSQDSKAWGQVVDCQKLQALGFPNFDIELWSVERAFSSFARGFVDVQCRSLEIWQVFFSLHSKSYGSLKIQCRDLDFQTLFAFGVPKFDIEQ